MTSTNSITFTAKKFNGLSLPVDREIGFVSVFKKKIDDVGTFTLSLSDASLKDLRSGQSVIVALERSIGDNFKATCAYDIGGKATTASVNLSKPINDNDLSLTATYKQQGSQFILQESWKFWDKKNKLGGSYNFANEEAIFSYDYIKDAWTLGAMYNVQKEAPTLTVSKKQGKDTVAVSMGVRDRSVAMSWNRKPFKAVVKGNVAAKGKSAVGVSSVSLSAVKEISF